MSTSACAYIRIRYQGVGELGKETTRLGSPGARMVVLAGRSPIGRENDDYRATCKTLGVAARLSPPILGVNTPIVLDFDSVFWS